MPEKNTSRENQRPNKRGAPMPEGPPEGTVEASNNNKRAKSSTQTKQELLEKVKRLEEELAKVQEEKKLLEEAAAEAETTKQSKIPVPKKSKNQKGPSYAMGDITAFLKKMPGVENANDYYESAQRFMKTAVKASNLDLTRTYKNCQDEPEMAAACRLIRKRYKAFANFENNWAARSLIRQYMKSVRSNLRESKKKAAEGRPKRPRARKVMMASAHASDEGENSTGGDDSEDED